MSLDPTVALRGQVHAQLLADSNRDHLVDHQLVEATVTDLAPLLSREEVDRLTAQVMADVHGLGPLEQLLADEGISDIMVVGERGVWIERSGVVEETGLVISHDEASHLIERVVAPLGLRIDRSSPMVDARLPDGSRVNAIVPPIAVDGPCLTIRRFAAKPIRLEAIASPAVAHMLRQAVGAKMNILISGGTGAGKTTLLNALAAEIGLGERVVTVEDAAELRLPLRHVVRLEGRPANSEGVGAVPLRQLVRNALRMRPDRIVVGEIRGGEALEMLQAMNTGHEGSMSTCHANSPRDAISRVETMVLMSEVALPLEAIRQQITSSIDLIVQIARLADGSRAVVEVAEVVMDQNEPSVRQLASQIELMNLPLRPSRSRMERAS